MRLFAVAFGAFFVFSSTFNYLPFYLSRPPFSASTEIITFMYLAYLVRIVMGPASGRLSHRFGGGAGITVCGDAYARYGWSGAAALNTAVLLLPLAIGL